MVFLHVFGCILLCLATCGSGLSVPPGYRIVSAPADCHGPVEEAVDARGDIFLLCPFPKPLSATTAKSGNGTTTSSKPTTVQMTTVTVPTSTPTQAKLLTGNLPKSVRVVPSAALCKSGQLQIIPLAQGKRLLLCSVLSGEETTQPAPVTVQHGVAYTLARRDERTEPPTTTVYTGPTTQAPTTAPTTTPTTAPTTAPTAAPSTAPTHPPETKPITTAPKTLATLPPTVMVTNSASGLKIHVVTRGVAKTCGWEVLFRMMVINTCSYPCWTTRRMVEYFAYSLKQHVMRSLLQGEQNSCSSQQTFCLSLVYFLNHWCTKSKTLGHHAFRGKRSVADNTEVIYSTLGQEGAEKLRNNPELVADVLKILAEMESVTYGGTEGERERMFMPLRSMDAELLDVKEPRPRKRRSNAQPRGLTLTDNDFKLLWRDVQNACCKSTNGCPALWLRRNYCAMDTKYLHKLRCPGPKKCTLTSTTAAPNTPAATVSTTTAANSNLNG